jgi:hypothetical protein
MTDNQKEKQKNKVEWAVELNNNYFAGGPRPRGNWQTTPIRNDLPWAVCLPMHAETLYTFSFFANELNPPAAQLIAHEGPRKLTCNIPEK